MKKYTKAQFKKAIKDCVDYYSSNIKNFDRNDAVKILAANHPEQMKMIAKADMELTMEEMGLA